MTRATQRRMTVPRNAQAVQQMVCDTDSLLPCLFIPQGTKLYDAKRTTGDNGTVGARYECARLRLNSKRESVYSFQVEAVEDNKLIVLQTRLQMMLGGTGTLVEDKEQQSVRHTLEWVSDTQNKNTVVTWTEELLWNIDYVEKALLLVMTMGCVSCVWAYDKFVLDERYARMVLYLNEGQKLPLSRTRV